MNIEMINFGLLVVVTIGTMYLVVRSKPNKLGKSGKRIVFIDTSVLIDGRILDIARAGFLGDKLYIPRSVLGELQLMADGADGEKRIKARQGLDNAKELQDITLADAKIYNDDAKAREGVDERLIVLAKKDGAMIATTDYNLNKVAAATGITVLNVNELASNLRMTYLPGEKAKIKLSSKGHDNHQAVGHLDDGTMVVVENSVKYIGKIIEVEFIRSLQTHAGKMMFAKRVETGNKQKKTRPQQ